MDLDLDAIEARAKAATRGPWRAEYDPEEDWHINMPVDDESYRYGAGQVLFEVDAAHIAGLDPQTVLALVARAREAERLEVEIETTRGCLDGARRSAGASHADWKEAITRATAAEAESARLRAVVEKLRKGLEPFGAVADHDVGSDETDADIYRPSTYNRAEKISIGHLRAATRLLAETAPDVPADQDGRAG